MKKGTFLGIFKRKTTQAPDVPPSTTEKTSIHHQLSGQSNGKINENMTSSVYSSTSSSSSTSGVAKTNVIHYTPPGTVRLERLTEKSTENQKNIYVERKSNIILTDETGMIQTPISQYDEQIVEEKKSSSKKKRAAPPPPTEADPSSSSSSYSPQIIIRSKKMIDDVAPTPPPHRKNIQQQPSTDIDYEEKLRRLEGKMGEWQLLRIEEGGSIREEKCKAEVQYLHDELKQLLENDNDHQKKKDSSKYRKPIQYGNMYPKSPVSPISTASNSSLSPRSNNSGMDENRNVIVSKKGNTVAVDRLRKELEEQRSREKEINGYKSIIELKDKEKEHLPRVIEYRPMKRIDKSPSPPPIPKTQPPRLSNYQQSQQQQQQKTSPIVSNKNGYVRVTVGEQPKKKETIYQRINGQASPSYPSSSSVGKEEKHYSNSPRLPTKQKIYAASTVIQPPKKENNIIYKKPEIKSPIIERKKKEEPQRAVVQNIRKSQPPPPEKSTDQFVISDILRAPRLRKVGLPVEKLGISVGKVVEQQKIEGSEGSTTPSAPPPPPPPPPPPALSSPPAKINQIPEKPKNGDLRDNLMSEIREAGRLRAARASQNA